MLLFVCLATLGGWMRYQRLQDETATVPEIAAPPQLGINLRRLHVGLGILLTLTVLLLLAIGVVGTLGHFGSLGHSPHLIMGLTVVSLTLTSAWSATQISDPNKPWARSLHLSINGLLMLALALVSWTGWVVVQKYLP